MWIRPNNWVASTHLANIVAKSNHASQKEFRFRHHSNNNILEWTISSDGSADSDVSIPEASLPTGQWHHIVGTWDTNGSKQIVYLNGAVVASASFAASNLFDGSANLAFGRSSDAGGPNDQFDGLLDDVRIYNRALSEPEIKRLYLLGNPTQ